MLGTTVPVQNDTFSSHAEAAEKQRRNDCGGVFHRSFSFVLPPTERYWYWHFSGSSTADESFTHSGSSDSHGAQSDGGKNKQLWFHQVFPPLSMAFLPPLSLAFSSLPPVFWKYFFTSPFHSFFFCFVLCHLKTWFNSVTYGVLRGISSCLTCQFGFV